MQAVLRTVRRVPELFVLTVLSLVTRCWGLFDPRAVVWDEVHYERYVSFYFSGTYYVDVHPPLGKMLLAGAARLLGVSGTALASNEPAPLLRILPALAGAFIIPAVYLLLRELGAGRRVATLAAILLLVDNALLVESRFILTDSMLIFCGIAAIALCLGALRQLGAKRWILLSASAFSAGMSVSIKWTGLSALGLVLLAWCADAVLRRRRVRRVLQEGLVLVGIPALLYVGTFAVHFALLPKTGPGEKWMSPEFQSTLEGSSRYDRSSRISLMRSVVELNRTMSAINTNWAAIDSPAASRWYTWPIAKHSIGFWALDPSGGGSQRWIILFGNPVVWWGALAGLLMTGAAGLRRSAALGKHRAALLFLIVAYAVNFVPFAFIRRPMFLYHYLFALIFSVMLAALGVGALAGWTGHGDEEPWRFSSRRSAALYSGVVGAAALMFAYLAPMSYGWPLSAAGVLHRRAILERQSRVES